MDKEKLQMIVNNYKELVEDIIGEEDFERFQKAIYKGTSCGASCQKIDNGVRIGSIVEGVDGDGTQYYDLTFPFDTKDFWDRMSDVEREAEELFNEQQAIEEMVAWENEKKYCGEDE